MFEVDVKKNVTEEGREGKARRGPARVWGPDDGSKSKTGKLTPLLWIIMEAITRKIVNFGQH